MRFGVFWGFGFFFGSLELVKSPHSAAQTGACPTAQETELGMPLAHYNHMILGWKTNLMINQLAEPAQKGR